MVGPTDGQGGPSELGLLKDAKQAVSDAKKEVLELRKLLSQQGGGDFAMEGSGPVSDQERSFITQKLRLLKTEMASTVESYKKLQEENRQLKAENEALKRGGAKATVSKPVDKVATAKQFAVLRKTIEDGLKLSKGHGAELEDLRQKIIVMENANTIMSGTIENQKTVIKQQSGIIYTDQAKTDVKVREQSHLVKLAKLEAELATLKSKAAESQSKTAPAVNTAEIQQLKSTIVSAVKTCDNNATQLDSIKQFIKNFQNNGAATTSTPANKAEIQNLKATIVGAVKICDSNAAQLGAIKDFVKNYQAGAGKTVNGTEITALKGTIQNALSQCNTNSGTIDEVKKGIQNYKGEGKGGNISGAEITALKNTITSSLSHVASNGEAIEALKNALMKAQEKEKNASKHMNNDELVKLHTQIKNQEASLRDIAENYQNERAKLIQKHTQEMKKVTTTPVIANTNEAMIKLHTQIKNQETALKEIAENYQNDRAKLILKHKQELSAKSGSSGPSYTTSGTLSTQGREDLLQKHDFEMRSTRQNNKELLERSKICEGGKAQLEKALKHVTAVEGTIAECKAALQKRPEIQHTNQKAEIAELKGYLTKSLDNASQTEQQLGVIKQGLIEAKKEQDSWKHEKQQAKERIDGLVAMTCEMKEALKNGVSTCEITKKFSVAQWYQNHKEATDKAEEPLKEAYKNAPAVAVTTPKVAVCEAKKPVEKSAPKPECEEEDEESEYSDDDEAADGGFDVLDMIDRSHIKDSDDDEPAEKSTPITKKAAIEEEEDEEEPSEYSDDDDGDAGGFSVFDMIDRTHIKDSDDEEPAVKATPVSKKAVVEEEDDEEEPSEYSDDDGDAGEFSVLDMIDRTHIKDSDDEEATKPTCTTNLNDAEFLLGKGAGNAAKEKVMSYKSAVGASAKRGSLKDGWVEVPPTKTTPKPELKKEFLGSSYWSPLLPNVDLDEFKPAAPKRDEPKLTAQSKSIVNDMNDIQKELDAIEPAKQLLAAEKDKKMANVVVNEATKLPSVSESRTSSVVSPPEPTMTPRSTQSSALGSTSSSMLTPGGSMQRSRSNLSRRSRTSSASKRRPNRKKEKERKRNLKKKENKKKQSTN